MKKKTLSLLLTLAMLMGLLPATALATDQTITWTVKEVTEEAGDHYYEGDDQIVVDVYVKGAYEDLTSAQFTATVPEGLTLVSITNQTGKDTASGNVTTGKFAWTDISGEGKPANKGDDGLKLATITYSIKADAATGGYAVGIDDSKSNFVLRKASITTITPDGESALTASVEVKNVKVQFAAGENGSLNGLTAGTTYYAKYNTAKVYSDMARGTEVEWTEAYTPAANYNFVKWTYMVEDDGNPETPAPTAQDWGESSKFTENMTLTANFKAKTFTLTKNVSADATITFVDGAGATIEAPTTVTYGEDVKFKLSANGSNAISGVVFTVAPSETGANPTLEGDVYTIPGTAITNDVTLTVTTQGYKTITFVGDNTNLESKIGGLTFYTTGSGLYTNKLCTEGPLTAAAFAGLAADAGYRLDKNNDEEPIFLVLATTHDESAVPSERALSSIVGGTYAVDTTITVKTVKTWDVTFTLAGDANKANIATGASQVIDDKGKPTAPTFTYEDGYELKGYTTMAGSTEVTIATAEIANQTIEANTAYYAIIGIKKYAVSFPTIEGASYVTFSSVAGLAKVGDVYYATHGTGFTFAVTVAAPASGTIRPFTAISYTVGGETTAYETARDGAAYIGKETASAYNFDVPAEKVTDAITIAATVEGTYTVTVAIDSAWREFGSIAPASKTYAWDASVGAEDFTVTLNAGYEVDTDNLPVGLSCTDGHLTGFAVNTTKTYDIPLRHATYTVTVSGETDTAIAETATHGTDFTWTPSVEGKIVYKVSAKIGTGAAAELTANGEGKYTIAGAAITGNIEITYTTLTGTWDFIEEYVAGTCAKLIGKKVAILKTEDSVSGLLQVDSKDMYRHNSLGESDVYGNSYVILVDSGKTKAQLSALLSKGESGTNEVLTNSDSGAMRGDVKKDGDVNVIDTAPINALLHNISVDYDITDFMILSADVLCDGTIAATDIQWIVEEFVGNHAS